MLHLHHHLQHQKEEMIKRVGDGLQRRRKMSRMREGKETEHTAAKGQKAEEAEMIEAEMRGEIVTEILRKEMIEEGMYH